MRTLLFALLCFWQCTAQATNYFVQDKSCEAISPEIEISLSATLRDLDNHQRKRQNLRQKALNKYTAQYKQQYEQLYVEEHFTTQSSHSAETPTISRAKKKLHYLIKLTPSKNCNQQVAMTSELFISGMHKRSLSTTIEGNAMEVTLDINNAPKFTQFNNPLITPTNFFGLQLGSSYEQVLATLGLASLSLSDKNNAILVYGRNHAFHFKNNVFIGYQFHEMLLPMVINNELSLANEKLQISTGTEQTISLDTNLTQQAINKLKNSFDEIETASYKVSIDKSEQRVVGISHGEIIKNIENTTQCYNGSMLADKYLKKHENSKTLKVVNEDHDNIIITPCYEFIYEGNDYISKLKLVEPFSTANIKLAALAGYINQSKQWSLTGINYNDPVSNLAKLGDYDEFFDSAEFTSEHWDGYFYIYDGKLLSAELTSNDY
ncbi:hypothetical protein CWC17_18010 [Pseudoalteromonas sp. S3785]|uniref:hypothetical protein n=1 Tax=Pseudoalteromonas sp. S3785 TaxID=579545 RepID=UPI00110BB6F0|nr:hypothetical protein [Pseudoalteromonas sp. S3785]TMO70927.1 hypothetical protein CWC17_18010 [Pseudoalteromonas sp. S3785]